MRGGPAHFQQVNHAESVSVPEILGPLGWAEAGARGWGLRSVAALLERGSLGSGPGGRSAPGSAHFRGGRLRSPSPPPTPKPSPWLPPLCTWADPLPEARRGGVAQRTTV